MAVTAKSIVRRNQAATPRREADEIPSTPIRLRRSLPASERQGTSKQPALTQRYQQPAQADVLDEEDQEQPMHITTDDLVERDGPVTRPPQSAKVTPLRAKQVRGYVQGQQQNIPWIKIILGLIVIAIVVWGVVWGILSLISFCSDVSNTYQYGPTRTSVVSGVFGMDNDTQASPTSVIAMNLKGTLVLESLPAGDASKMKTYPTGLTLVGDSAAKLPVILTIKDLNGDHKPDVLVEIPGQSITLKLINNGTGFTLTK
jgi:hypothetical protein